MWKYFKEYYKDHQDQEVTLSEQSYYFRLQTYVKMVRTEKDSVNNVKMTTNIQLSTVFQKINVIVNHQKMWKQKKMLPELNCFHQHGEWEENEKGVSSIKFCFEEGMECLSFKINHRVQTFIPVLKRKLHCSQQKYENLKQSKL